MKHESNLTSKGQVTIPKDIRDALGLKPGSKVRFEMNAAGNAVIKAADTAQEYAQREAEIVNRVREARAFARLAPRADTGKPTCAAYLTRGSICTRGLPRWTHRAVRALGVHHEWRDARHTAGA